MAENTTRRGFLKIVGCGAVAAVGATHGHLTAIAVTPDPSGVFLPCEGQLLSTREFPELFEVLGRLYGGDGDQFALPDFRLRYEAVPDGSGFGSMKAICRDGLGYEINPTNISFKHAMKVRPDSDHLPVGGIILTLAT